MFDYPLIFLTSYLLGSIPTGFIVTRLVAGIDIRQVGSGNIGATNVHRVLGWTWYLVVLLVDMTKGMAAVWLAHQVGEGDIIIKMLAGATAVAGHNWTIFLKFKGGRGVATSAGVFIGLAPYPMLLIIPLFIIIVALTKYVSLGSVMGALVLPLLLWLFKAEPPLLIFGGAVSVIIVVKHIPNIKRLLAGQENKFGSRVELKQ
ncbi:MAG: glycerol-3-phosphate 1-O-acyltransferase PlsY [bacterium]